MPKERDRVIIDTNLWISFLLTRDFSKLDRLLSANRMVLLVSPELLEEIVEVAGRPKFRKYFDLYELTGLLVNLRQKAELIQVGTEVTICRDDKDNFLLSLATDGKATHLLTGDKDLLDLRAYGETKIVTISAYLSER